MIAITVIEAADKTFQYVGNSDVFVVLGVIVGVYIGLCMLTFFK